MHDEVQLFMSPFIAPSSHSSLGPTSPSPHAFSSQSAEHCCPGPLFGPSSQASPASTTPSPHIGPPVVGPVAESDTVPWVPVASVVTSVVLVGEVVVVMLPVVSAVVEPPLPVVTPVESSPQPRSHANAQLKVHTLPLFIRI